MKNFLLMFVLVALSGCAKQKNEIARLTLRQDSMAVLAEEKDSAILDFLVAFNEIQANLDSIKKLEQIVSVARNPQVELRGNQKKQVLEDIALLNELIQKNKELNASLQQKLKNSNLRVGELQGVVNEFERMVSSLSDQVEMKNQEISQLNQDVERLHTDVAMLAGEVITFQQEVVEKQQVIQEQTELMNKVYFALGTVRELTDNLIIEKSGGMLGIGRTLRIRKDFNHGYFTEADQRGLN